MAVLAICYQSRDELSCSILDMHLNGVHKMHIIQDGRGWKKELLIVMCGSNHFSKHKDDPHFFPEKDYSDKPWEMTTAKAS